MPDLTLPGAGDSSEKSGGPKSNSSPGAAARLPAVDRLLASPQLNAVAAEHGTLQVKHAVQEVLAENRTAIVAGAAVPDSETLVAQVQLRLSQVWASRLRPVFNLSGTVIHTNFGRALLAEEAITAVATAMRSYTALEYDVGSGGRGDRDHIVEDLLRELTDAEAATVVNNNAAAVLLSLKALCARKEAVISRGELIEIGGAFRMPDIMKAAGCKLVEVGTTNRTHARDYKRRMRAEDRVDRQGALVELRDHWIHRDGRRRNIGADRTCARRTVHGGSGSGSADRPSVARAPEGTITSGVARAGADVVTFSGDKLLGGPQAGLIVGRADVIAKIKKDPLKRALRVSKADDGCAGSDVADLRERASARRTLADACAADAPASRNPRGVRANCKWSKKRSRTGFFSCSRRLRQPDRFGQHAGRTIAVGSAGTATRRESQWSRDRTVAGAAACVADTGDRPYRRRRAVARLALPVAA